jgi:hypothetical protein
MAEHHQKLREALKKHGLRRGVLTLGQYRSAVNTLAPDRAPELGCMNPYARQIWARTLHRAIVTHGQHTKPLFMLTILHHPWHLPWGEWRLDPEGIIAHARAALAGLDYLLLLELAPLLYFGRRYLAPHLQGFLFADLPRRRRQRLASHFAGGLGGARPLVLKRVHDLTGACRYNVKPPDHMEVCFANTRGVLVHRGRRLWLTEHFHLWQHLHPYTYPDFTFAAGLGTRVLRSALREAAAGPLSR